MTADKVVTLDARKRRVLRLRRLLDECVEAAETAHDFAERGRLKDAAARIAESLSMVECSHEPHPDP